MTRRLRAWLRARRAAVVLTLVIVALAGVNLLFTARFVNENNHKWCSALVTLDDADQAALKAPPAQKPKGAYSFALISDFHQLRRELGCG